ncbi:serine/threonine protein kinase [Bythopirellula polymerisocia]|uniref:Serine/threonine-protein kinase PknB n=1 Tax=Bythopirellula polymerisocia TaxID=2528003 RepID=A0A5C6CER5_9BACT|nr:serine/threonine-protein kinase [Bythopirellula polymerisocia]TWU22592.1 Serine/threonine-protein kinase PknB [Bythopirellula polymerisocia]
MNSAPSHAKQIFLDAIEKYTPDQWPGYLEEACGEDAALRRRVEVLLEAHRSDASLLDEPAIEIEATIEHSPLAERPGVDIGPYKLLEQIGEGGFGVVFLAEQTRPVRREVALKIVKAGMDTKEVIARFEAERQALAMMDHPNIAKVLDAGTTESGRPYFVMELVHGIPINEYCDQCKLTTRERLELFVLVCQAVQHAHQKGVIHRDIKPSNVLIAMQDGRPAPKIIDFGVAKAINQRLTEHTLKTRFAQIIGTPLYMSPEQAELSPLGVDTRSDIYSLGVLLYELLTGTTPFEKDRLQSASFDELRQIIREEEPPRPSTRISTLSADLASTVADRHRTDVRQLQQTVRGDLDWLVMKAMEKDRNRRYESASSLARDVERYLQDEPVEACPPSAAYRFRKYIRRNKVVIATMAVVATALVVGAGVATWQAIRATVERDRAIAAEKVAGTEAARSEQVAQFLKDMLAAAGPSVARGRDATLLREVLEGTAERVERDLADQPEIQGDMWFTLGSTYQDIGYHKKAVETFQRAVNCFRDAPGEPNTKLAVALGSLGYSQCFIEQAAEGKANAQAGLDMARLVSDQETLALCLCNRAGSSTHWGMGSDEAVPFLTESLELYREMGNRPLDEAACIQRLAACEIGDDHGESLARQAHEMFHEHLGPDHHKTLGAQWVLGQILLVQGKEADAEPLLRQTLVMRERIYDKDHPMNQVVRRKLAACLTLQGNRVEANEILRGASKASEPLEVMYLLYYLNVVGFLSNQERYDEAVPIMEEMRNKYDEVQSIYGSDHNLTKEYQNALAKLYAMTGQPKEARKWYDEADGVVDKNGARAGQTQHIRTEVSRLLGIENAELPGSVKDE